MPEFAPAADAYKVATKNVDAEMAVVAGPQLVAPLSDAAAVRAATEARKYLGLNIRGCICAPIGSKSDGLSAAYRCRVTYEVLVRTSSN